MEQLGIFAVENAALADEVVLQEGLAAHEGDGEAWVGVVGDEVDGGAGDLGGHARRGLVTDVAVAATQVAAAGDVQDGLHER